MSSSYLVSSNELAFISKIKLTLVLDELIRGYLEAKYFWSFDVKLWYWRIP
jgi:hypothetical protein